MKLLKSDENLFCDLKLNIDLFIHYNPLIFWLSDVTQCDVDTPKLFSVNSDIFARITFSEMLLKDISAT